MKSLIRILVLIIVVTNPGGQGLCQKPDSINVVKKIKLNFHLKAESNVAYEFKNKKIQKAETIVQPTFSLKMNRRLRLQGSGRLYLEASDNLEPGIPDQSMTANLSKRWFIGERSELELREFYLHIKLLKRLNFSVGKQFHVWGETDRFNLLNIIHPQYYRAFILKEFEEDRISLWTVKTDAQIGKTRFQLIFVPDQSYHNLAGENMPYFFSNAIPQELQSLPFTFLPPDKPDRFFKDADLGVQLARYVNSWDLTLNYLYQYDNFPVFNGNLSLEDTGLVLSIQPEYKRQHMIGGTFNKPVRFVTLRGEIACTFNRHFLASDFGITRHHQFLSLLGVDYIKDAYFFSVQLFNNMLTNHELKVSRKRNMTSVSLFISKTFLDGDLKSELEWVQELTTNDGMFRPLLSYRFNNNMECFMRTDLFYGNGIFGQFKERNRITTGLKWKF